MQIGIMNRERKRKSIQSVFKLWYRVFCDGSTLQNNNANAKASENGKG